MDDNRSFWGRLAGSTADGIADDAFLQKRITLYIRILFYFMLAILGLATIRLVMPLGGEPATARALVPFATLVLVTALIALDWWILGRKQWPGYVLHWFETGGTIVGATMVASTALFLPNDVPGFVLLLVIILALTIRAAVVPSLARRTFFVGAVTTAALAAFIYPDASRLPEHAPVIHRFMHLFVAVWGLMFAAATAVVSRVIYGLQRSVEEALQLGNYTLEHKLGEGGMGAVYLARHALLRRKTAIKLLPPDKAGESSIARFEREVQQTSRLRHPNTIQIFDFGRTPDGIFYYAMEYLEGLDLGELIELEGLQPPGRVIYILGQAAHALSEAHGRGLIHRDIKPANIVLCNRGGMADMAKVVDFGLVKDVSAPPQLALSSATTITGTPLYMSPEALARPQDVDHRSDLYALGAVGYFLLTGTHVFEGETPVEVLGHHLHTKPERPSARIEGDLAHDVEDVMLRCLEKDPADRFDSGDELFRALRSCVDARSWGLDEATAWWAEHDEQIHEFRAGKRSELGAGSARTIAIAIRERIED